MHKVEIADLYMRFYKWYNDNISTVDFRVVKDDMRGKTHEQQEKVFIQRLSVIYELCKYRSFFDADKIDKLQLISHHSFPELEMKLALFGY